MRSILAHTPQAQVAAVREIRADVIGEKQLAGMDRRS
jgi:hypothetical protein